MPNTPGQTSDISTLLKISEETAVIAAGTGSKIINWMNAANTGSKSKLKGKVFDSYGIKPGTLGTKEVRWPYINKLPGNFYFPTETGTIGANGFAGGAELKLGLYQAVIPSMISYLAKQVGTVWGPDNINLLELLLSAQERIFGYMMKLAIEGDGTGIITRVRTETVVGAADTSVTLPVLDTAWLEGRRGMYVDVMNTTTATLDSWMIESWDRDAGTVTLSGTALGGGGATVVKGAYIYAQDTRNLPPPGILAAVSDGSLIGDGATPSLYWHTAGTATYANATYTTTGMERHKGYIHRLAVRASHAPGTLEPWNEHDIIAAALGSERLRAEDAPKVNMLRMRKYMLQYLLENSKTVGDRITNVPPEGLAKVTFGWPTEDLYFMDECFENGKAAIVVDETAPNFSVQGLAMPDIGFKQTAAPGYFGDQMESLANSQDILAYAWKFGVIGTPIIRNRGAHFIMVDGMGHNAFTPLWMGL